MRRLGIIVAAVVLTAASLAVLVPAPGRQEQMVRLPAVPGTGAGPAKDGGVADIRPATPERR